MVFLQLKVLVHECTCSGMGQSMLKPELNVVKTLDRVGTWRQVEGQNDGSNGDIHQLYHRANE